MSEIAHERFLERMFDEGRRYCQKCYDAHRYDQHAASETWWHETYPGSPASPCTPPLPPVVVPLPAGQEPNRNKET